MDEHETMVAALKQVDVVISTLAVPQHLEQFKIIDAIKKAGNIKVHALSLSLSIIYIYIYIVRNLRLVFLFQIKKFFYIYNRGLSHRSLAMKLIGFLGFHLSKLFWKTKRR